MSVETIKPLMPPASVRPSKIRVSLYAGRSASAQEADGPLSPWLYIGGLCATLCAVYAVTYGIDDANYGFMLYVLAVSGFVMSYILRLKKISLQNYQIPLFVCLGLIFYMGVSSGIATSLSSQTDGMPDRTRVIQLALTWFTVLFSFMLQSDGAVLFLCVPCLAILALVSTANTDAEIQTVFMTFVGAATFLMVHENSLRIRHFLIAGSPALGERKQMVGQLMLVGVCLLGASLIANLVAAPIRQLIPTLWMNGGLESNSQKMTPFGMQNIPVQDQPSIELAAGSSSSSPLPLLSIHSEMPGLYWRGTTFDYYDGQRFKNRMDTTSPVEPERQPDLSTLRTTSIDPNDSSKRGSVYQIHPSIYELPARDMKNSRRVKQTVEILAGSLKQIYGAGYVEEITTTLPTLQTDPAGGIMTAFPLHNGDKYLATSVVATGEPDTLRGASSEVPTEIARTYLLKVPAGGTESAPLRSLAEELTRGKTNNYDRAEAIRSAIAARCQYTLQPPIAPAGRDCVEFFLFDAKQGDCNHFGAAMTMLCRYAGIPSRMASGFITGEKQNDGSFLVREKDKHAWSEVYFPHIGWVPFEATEGSLDVSDHSEAGSKKRVNLLAWFTSHGVMPPLIALMALVLLGYVVKVEIWDRMAKRRRSVAVTFVSPPTNQSIVESYLRGCSILARRGMIRPETMTPEEFLARLTRHPHTPPEALQPLSVLTTLHARFRYGGEVATDQDARTAQEAVGSLKASFAGIRTRTLALAFAQTSL